MMHLPPAFDSEVYRTENPDLAALDDEAARAHWEREGRAAGRIAAPLATREDLLAHIAGAESVLEIGPFCRPLLTGPQVEYLDILDAPALRERARKHGLDPARCPERIHHVGDLAQVDRSYAAVVSSHAIEHQPDLVRHLNEVERVLAPGGAFYLLVPDKRYCLDHFLPETGIAQVLQAHRERRRVHSFASVIEHRALTTHNDNRRHWEGDHGPPPGTLDAAAHAADVAAATARYDAAEGGYIDVHAWQFTPDSFRATIATLNALGLTGIAVGEVYDTVRGRNEFAAVLRADPAAASRARTRASAIRVTAIQTADPVRYAPMLAASQPNVAEFCRRHGHRYEAFIGIKRGFHAWQATYNRIPLLSELLASGFRGWAFYLDADAWIADLDFDLLAYLDRHGDRAAILAASGVTDRSWDVNAGVALVNLGHPQGRRLVERWQALFDAIPDARLRAAEAWLDDDNDQDLLHQLLRADPELMAAVRVETMDFMNSRHARFVRQHLRAQAEYLPARVRAIAAEATAALRAAGGRPPPPPDPIGERWRWRLAHPPGNEPELVAAADAPPRLDLAARVITEWTGLDAPRPHEADFVAALDAGDADGVATMLSGLGRAAIGRGIFGGAQQHERAADALFSHRLALWTHDRLVSLAEAVGALEAELPEEGSRWAENAALAPDTLWRVIGDTLGVDLTPPATIGGQLGVAAGEVVVHQRMLDAIHAAWRLRQLGPGLRVAELGGGAGLLGHYAARFESAGHLVVTGPVGRAVQRYVLGDRPSVAFADKAGGADILVSLDTLPALSGGAAAVRDAREAGVRLLLSIDQEARLPGQRTATETIAEAGGWRLVSRHRHWLRAGFIETVWRAG